MSATDAVRTCFRKYATFTGTASRPEYWWFALFNSVGSLVLYAINVPALRGLWGLALLLPGLAVAVRRLHDTGRSAWWLLASIIPPWEIILLCLPGTTVANPYASGGAVETVTNRDAASSAAYCASCGKLRLPGQAYCTTCGAPFADA